MDKNPLSEIFGEGDFEVLNSWHTEHYNHLGKNDNFKPKKNGYSRLKTRNLKFLIAKRTNYIFRYTFY